MTATFSVKNFEKFQHYKDRSPPWIKLYNELLDDYDFGLLPDASKMHLVAIWLLASRSNNKIPLDPLWVAKKISATDPVDLTILRNAGFIEWEQDSSDPLAERLQVARPEREKRTSLGEGEETLPDKSGGAVVAKTIPEDFETFWKAYSGPKNSKKPDALKAWAATAKIRPPLPDLLRAVANYLAWVADESRKQKREYPKQHHSTWLRGEMWNNYGDGGAALTVEEIAANKDRADRLMRRGKYAETYA